MVIFTEEILNQGKSKNGFWSNKQLYALGLTEIKKGWKRVVIGKELPDEFIQLFLALKNKHLKKEESTNQSITSIQLGSKLIRDTTNLDNK